MRAVLDTNVLISGLLWRGPPYVLIERARAGDWTMVSSHAILDEFARAVRRRMFKTILARIRLDPDRMLRDLHLLTEIVEPPTLAARVSRDPTDDMVLSTAVAGHADLIVSGDDDLLALRGYQGIPIVEPGVALRRLR